MLKMAIYFFGGYMMLGRVFLLFLFFLPLSGYAKSYWTQPLADWSLYLDNGVVYVTANNMPSHCTYSRAQIDTSTQVYSLTYQRDIYAYILAAYTAKKPLTIVVNDQDSICKITGVNDRP